MPRQLQSNEADEETEINLSPMIDCIFILLIFFIVTTVFVEDPGVEPEKPFAPGPERLEKNSFLVAITNDNKLIYGGKESNIPNIVIKFKQQKQKNNLPVIIIADRNSEQGIVSRLHAELANAGAEKISFSTENMQ